MLTKVVVLGLVASASAFSPSALQPLSLRAHRGALGLRAQSSNRPESLIDLATSSLASLARPGAGAFVSGYRAEIDPAYENPSAEGVPVKEFSENLPSFKPVKSLELYEFEACPFCRKVREAISMLDLDVTVYPCPKDGSLYRPKVEEMGGKAQFPYLVDANTQFAGYESDDIIRYLFQTYGDGIIPLELSMGPLTTASAAVASSLRRGKGSKADPERAAPPGELLELWSFEGSPFCRLVRERLCELELPYKVVTVARGSSKREQLKQIGGKVQVPFLVDPNTDTQMYESGDIISYLDKAYGSKVADVSTSATDFGGQDSAPTTPITPPVTTAEEPGWEETPVAEAESVVDTTEAVTVEAEVVEDPVAEDPETKTGTDSKDP